MEAKNYKTPLDNTDTTVKNEKDTFNKNTMNETDTHEEDHSSKDKEQPGLAWYARLNFQRVLHWNYWHSIPQEKNHPTQ